MNNTYCPLPWIFKNIEPNGSVAPCACFAKRKNLDPTFADIKKKMLAGEPVEGCKPCYLDEKCGIRSDRTNALKKYGIITEEKLLGIDIAFDNLCNLQCKSCSSVNSHKHYKEEQLIFGVSRADSKFLQQQYYKDLDYTHLQDLIVYGGEPLLSSNFEEFCRNLLLTDRLNLELTLSTNGTVIPERSILDFMLSVDRLKLYISLDGYNKLNDYLRTGSDWKTISQNLDFFNSLYDRRKEKSTIIVIHSVVTSYNVNMLHELDNFIKLKYPRFFLSKQCATGPSWMSIRNLPTEYKDLLNPLLDEYPQVKSFLNQEPTSSFDEFIPMHNHQERLRICQFKEINSMFESYIKEYTSNHYNQARGLALIEEYANRIRNRDW